MNILFDINHPAQFHLFRNFYFYLKNKNHKVVVSIRDRDFTKTLCELYGVEYHITSIAKSGILGFSYEFIKKEFELINLQRKEKFEIGFGTSLFLSHLTLLFNFKDYNFIEDDDEWVTFHRLTAYPFAYRIVIPRSLKYKYWDNKRIKHDSYHELAYLHPNRFTPNPEVLKEIGLTENDKFFVVRFVSWEATHDIGQKGLSLEDKRKLIEILKPHGKIIITSEKELPEEFEEYRMRICPTKIHDLLYYATMYIGESGTMASEACILGTFSIFINNSFHEIKLPGVLEDQKKYGLVIANNVSDINSIIQNQLKYELWDKNNARRLNYINLIKNEKIDTTNFILDLIY